jgi:hypothetical protein
MLRRQHEERRPEERVGPGGEHRDVLVELLDAEQHLGALRAADPVSLHRLDPVLPFDRRQVVQQLVGVCGRLEEPLLEVLRDDLRAAVLAPAVVHLLVRKHDLVERAPLHRGFLAVREPGFEELQEEPLRPAVVRGLVRRDEAAPVVAPPHPLHGPDDLGDVPLDELAWVAALADCGVLGREPEGVEAHDVHDVHPVAAAEAREDVPDRVDEAVAHVERPGRVRPHLDHEALVLPVGVRLGIEDAKGLLVLPDAHPLRFGRVGVVSLHEDKKASPERGRGRLPRRCRACSLI